ncbi:glycosyltransferase involved in cell wall biosynthesis [Algoriphagus boseongensis]|uniref:Glycosyltransferase involved in cell wall biosynthesis n=2 Tax=Algoriphagus boseongensis TaxID=1442587 RepID=A0A4R6TBI8_9BACT|nr:glycosyltransferase involved in cell wall biosynthesis [Algoriphagus boseongensis]
MITYNQAEFIQQAIIGVLNQKCNFEFELILSNDSSKDQSNQIILNTIKNHPNGGRVKYFFQANNLGMNKNLKFALENCSGKYVAMCEGDDYWIDTLKLQKQVDFLEANDDFALCFHSVDVLFQDGSIVKDFFIKDVFDKSDSTIYDLAAFGNYIHTPSVVFRNNFLKLSDNFIKSPIGDYYLWILISQHGKIKKISEVMATYRIGVGYFSSKSEEDRAFLFLSTLELISANVENRTVSQVLKCKIDALKFRKLPHYLRNSHFNDEFSNPKFISSFISIKTLILAIFEKVKRRYKLIF